MKEKYVPLQEEIKKAEEIMTPEQKMASERREKEKQLRKEQLEMLANIVQEHPEVIDTLLTPQMIASFAQYLETPSGEVFVAIREKEGMLYNPGRWMQLFTEKPKGILIMEKCTVYNNMDEYKGEPANPIVKYEIHGQQGHGGLETLPNYVTPALGDLTKKMDLLNKEEIREATIEDRFGGIQAQTFLYTFRRRQQKR